MKKLSDKQIRDLGLETGKLPKHVGIIMDGNGRWAANRSMMRMLGHRAGMERLRGLIRLTSDLGIEALSLYAFSTENWRRPKAEVGALFELLLEYFTRELDELHANKVCIRILGDTSPMPRNIRGALAEAMNRTMSNPGLKLNIALNYGSRSELAYAARNIAEQVAAGGLKPSAVTEDELSRALYTGGLPDLDLVIRTGGEKRLSNFMLYQAAYAELLFSDTYFPDFSNEEYIQSLREFQRRIRRYGALA